MFARAFLPTLLIFIILLIFGTFFYGLYYIYVNKKQIDQNWPQYRCKPYVFPFAGWLIGPGNTNPMDNFKECSWLIFKSFFDVLISPFVKILTIIVDILTNFNKDIQNIRKMTNYIRGSVRSIALDTYHKIWDAYYRIAYIYKAFMRVFLNIFKTMQASFDVLLYSFYSLASLWNGPIGGTARFFCFGGNTPVQMLNENKYKSIKRLKIGDQTAGGMVLATYVFQPNTDDMYYIKDLVSEKKTYVSGSHLLRSSDGRWMRVRDYPLAVKCSYKKKIYSIKTSKSLIFTGLYDPDFYKIIFRDYDEIEHYFINRTIFFNQILNLNVPDHRHIYEHKSIGLNPQSDFKPLFDKDTPIEMKNGGFKAIKKIKLGDEIAEGGRVIGLVKSHRLKTPIYQFKGTIGTQGVVVKNRLTGKWNSIDEYGTLIENYPEKIMYSLLTENGVILIDSILFRDHDINPEFQDIVDQYIVDKLNNICQSK